MKEFTLGIMYWMNPRLSAGEVRRDCRNIAENGYRMIRIIVWWELVEEREGKYDFSLVDRVFAAAAECGLKIMCTIGFYPPFWLTARLDALGKNDPGRYPSLEHSEVREPLAALIRELVTRYAASPALESWNVWNEPTPNLTKNRPVLEQFAAWLNERYPSRAELLENWRGEYPVFCLLAPGESEPLDADWLERAFRLGSRGRSSAMAYDYAVFSSTLFRRELGWLCDEVKLYDRKHPTHTNFHSIHDNPASIGREDGRAAGIPDSISCSMHQSNDNPRAADPGCRRNFYRCGVDRTWSWLKGGRAMVGELQVGTSDVHFRQQYTPTPETVAFELWQSYAAGLEGVIHWLWQAWRAGTFENGEFGLRAPADGGETPRSRAVAEFARLFRENREMLLAAEREPARIAILDSFSDGIYRLLQQEARPGAPGIVSRGREAQLGCFRALSEANFQVDFVSDDEVAAGLPERYRVLFLPQVNLVGKAVAKGIAAFVRRGGAVWADGRFGWQDEHMYLRGAIPGHGLDELFGVREADYIAVPGTVSANTSDGREVSGERMRQTFGPAPDARIHARYSDGGAAAVDHTAGKGRTRIWGMELTHRLHGDFHPAVAGEITGFALACGVEPMLRLPEGVTGRRLTGEGVEVLVLHNGTEAAVPLRLETGGVPVKSLCGPSVRDGAAVRLELAPDRTEVLILGEGSVRK